MRGWKKLIAVLPACLMSNIYRSIIELVRKAAHLGAKLGIENILQPGLVKEMIIADTLGHQLITSKRHADACDPNNPKTLYEYLSCKEGGSGQLDRMFKHPPSSREKSLKRISRNHKIFLAVFYKSDQLQIKTIYEIAPEIMENEAIRQLERSSNDISHVSFSETWAQKNGKEIYQGKKVVMPSGQ